MLIPVENERELVEIPKNIRQNLEIRPVRWIEEVLQIAMQSMPEPLPGDPKPDTLAPDKAETADESDVIRPH